MKRIISFALLFSLLFSLCACGGKTSMNDLADYFDEDVYSVKRMTDSEIETFKQKRNQEAELRSTEFSGEIQYVIHAFDKTVTSASDAKWAYIVQFTDEAGAESFEKFLDNHVKTKRFANVLIYGNSPVIDEIDE